MGKIKLTVPGKILNGKHISFKAPCDSISTTGLTINNVTYTMVDAVGSSVIGVSGLWAKNAMLSAILDVTNKKAYIQNAVTSREPIGSIMIGSPNETGARGVMSSSWLLRGLIQSIKDDYTETNVIYTNDEVKSYFAGITNSPWYQLKVLKNCSVVIRKHYIQYEYNTVSKNYFKNVKWTLGSKLNTFSSGMTYYGENPYWTKSIRPYLFRINIPEQKAEMKVDDIIDLTTEIDSAVAPNNSDDVALCLRLGIVIDVYA